MLPDAATDPVEILRSACRDRAIWLSADDRVRESDAGALLGKQPKTLSNWRAGSEPIPYVKRAGRPLYALSDLAAWIVANDAK